jgi:hypothetical protein
MKTHSVESATPSEATACRWSSCNPDSFAISLYLDVSSLSFFFFFFFFFYVEDASSS